jgi:hypothetical protein
MAGTSPFDQQIVLGTVLIAAGLLDFMIRHVATATRAQRRRA